MRNNRIVPIALVVGCLTFSPGFSLADGGSEGMPLGVDGVVGLRPVTAQSCVAVWVSIPEGQALSGFTWFNNDGSTVYPEILLESGTPVYPVVMDGSLVVAENYQGAAFGWSEVELEEPTACLSEGLYILFRFPEGSEYTSDGIGGGAAMGYRTDGQGCPGWISADGEDWVEIKGDFGFALQPQFISAADATVVMKSLQGDPKDGVSSVKKTMLFGATPNPFNPSTKLRFDIAQSGRVELSIYSLRGELVKRLVSQVFDSGSHEVVWEGRDDSGRHVSSGVYFARMQAGKVVMTQRMVLVQ